MKKKISNSQMRDTSSKLIFSDPILCAQFLRDYVDIPLLKDVQPENIEDVTGRYLHMFTEERNSDSVSRIRIQTNETKYPPILPIVFYDGVDKWTAPGRPHDRILFSDVFDRYIPDYQCVMIKLSDYTNAELMKKKDELSVIMMVDRLQNAADYEKMIREVNSD